MTKVTSRDRQPAPASSPTSRLAVSSTSAAAAGYSQKTVNNKELGTWRERSQTKSTWLGAEIPNTSPLGAIGALVLLRSTADEAIREEVAAARLHGLSWVRIAERLRTTPEAARQRYGK